MAKLRFNRMLCLRAAAFLLAGTAYAAALSFSETAQAQQNSGCPGTSVPIDVSFGSKPFVRMRLGERDGNFLIDTGAARSHIDTTLFGVPAGPNVKIQGSTLPTLDEGTFIAQDLAHQQKLAPPGGYAGAIGTDILSTRVVAFHYNTTSPYLVLSNRPCSPRYFEQAGFVSVSQKGLYGPPNLRSPQSMNLPVIYIKIGSLLAPVWIDSGLGDVSSTSRHMTILVNEALFQQVRDAGIAMKQMGTVTTIDCKGTKSDDKLWQLEGVPFAFATQDGQSLFEYSPPTLQVRGPTQCGTIGAHSEPLGTVGALMLARWGTVVFDGPNEKLWVTKNGSPTTSQAAYRSIALARNDGTGWAATIGNTFDNAKAASLSSCNEKYGDCKIEASIGPNQFACLALVKSSDQKRWQATNGSLTAARSTALATCAEHGGSDCKVEYSACND
jgi:hypothetical protein